ncbi:substrate-binding domain-containing protein [Nocardioides sp. CER19]|uniref:sugar ABC transporter substrate-binding protein n=1 Tax=Nocardioides sp. CER19 TaxID=3038538 RepID=UPI00244C68C2|nr:substrate-binding domain-containing protein [Nocardioides sp. CER19]MDH2413001.1 substrate-binding domain-containing protein [Nocardioides sp. CER19]
MSRTPTNRRRRAAALGAVVASLALLGACAQNDAPGASAGSSAEDPTAGIEQAKSHLEELAAPLTAASYPKEPALSKPVDLAGKKVLFVALGDNIPVIHGGAVGAGEALKAVGATSDICDGKFTPTVVADCLQRAVDRRYDAVIASFIDYDMAGAAFDAVEKAGIPVLLGGVAAPADKKPSTTLAFYDNTPRVNELYGALSESALAHGGADTNALWLRLTDSTTTTDASDAGIDRFKKLCPSCGLASTDFATANIDKMPGAVSAALLQHPDTNVLIVPVDSFVPPAMQGVQSAGLADKVTVISSSSDLAGLQRLKSGDQAVDLGTSVVYEGWKLVNALEQLLAGDEVRKGDTMVTRAFTPDNVNDLTLDQASYFTTSWFGDDSFKDAFLTAWGVK